jgi:nucleoid DNA-binding protein
MDIKFIIAFKEVLREQFVNKNSVEIDGLGQFKVIHLGQHQKKYDNGMVVMIPPADVLEFKSNIRISDENRSG